MQIFGGEIFRQRFRAQVPQQFVVFRHAGQPQDGTEAARVVIAQQCVVGKYKIHMVVFVGCRLLFAENPQAAGHAQMNQQHAGFPFNQQVFGAAAAALHGLPGQGFR